MVFDVSESLTKINTQNKKGKTSAALQGWKHLLSSYRGYGVIPRIVLMRGFASSFKEAGVLMR